MKDNYTSRLLLAGGLLLAGWLGAPAAHAQFAYKPDLATNSAGTYTDLGSTGTAIATANTDDANSAVQSIGFSFNYNGSTFTQFVLNTNGLLRLGAVAPAVAAHANYAQAPEQAPINGTDTNLVMPFNFDLTAGTGTPEYRVATTGTAGSRVCTIQWKNVADKALAVDGSTSTVLATQYSNLSFQVKLYEGSNAIDFVYGPATAGTGTANAKYILVGLKGNSATIGNDVLAFKYSSDDWSAAEFITSYQYSADDVVAFNVRATVLPDAGRTLHFTTCTPAVVGTFPYTESFDGVAAGYYPCGITGEDVNHDLYTWFVGTDAPSSGANSLEYIYNDTDTTVAANDWIYTPGLQLRAGFTYQLQFKYRVASASFAEGLEVKYGTAATPAAQTTTLFANSALVNTAYATTTPALVQSITPNTTGTYYIGFHVRSPANRFALLLDDWQVTEAKALAVRNPTNAVFTAEAAPVPFGDNLMLTLNTLKAGPAQLTLHDALGRTLRQHTVAAPLGASTIALPDAGSLPGGVYLLTVEQGGARQVLRVVK